jgi:hypothetical protein
MSVIGIDPGISGGIALIKNGNAVVAKMGHTERDTYEILQSYAEHEPFAYIESVHSMPKQGVASSFKFGVNYGLLKGKAKDVFKILHQGKNIHGSFVTKEMLLRDQERLQSLLRSDSTPS